MYKLAVLIPLLLSAPLFAETQPNLKPMPYPKAPPAIVIDVKPALIDMFKKTDIQSLLKSKGNNSSGGGGWGSSGGGGGVACFKDAATSKEAGLRIQRDQTLPPDLLAKVTSLETLEYWEWRTIAPFDLVQSNAKNADEIVKLTHYRVAQMLPLFAYRLEQAAELIQFKDWDSKVRLSRIDDARPKRPIPANCQLIQLAARFTKESYEKGQGPAKSIPFVKVELNRPLYEKLDEINKAVLILHEQLYLLGQMTGHKDSNEIRNTVILFLNAKLGQVSDQPALEAHALKTQLVRVFGDYLNYFGDDLKLDAQPYTQESRFMSYYVMLDHFRTKTADCNNGKMPESEKIRWRTDITGLTCRDYAMNPDLYSDWLTEEMSFIYLSSYLLDFQLHKINSEFLIVPFDDGPLRSRAEHEVLAACDFVKQNLYRFTRANIPGKMVRYCDGLIQSLSPKGIGRN